MQLKKNKELNKQVLVQQLKKTQNYLNNIISLLPEHIYWMDLDGRIVGCNEQQARTFGLITSEQLIGKNIYDVAKILHWEKQIPDRIHANDSHVIKNKQGIEIEEMVVLNQEEHIFSVYKRPLFDEDGDVIGVIGISTDITSRKKMEEELKQAKETAEIANKAKDEFLFNMRHDIRTSLSGIQGFSELIKGEAHDEKISTYADNLVASCRALTNIHNQFLRAIRVFSGNIPLYKNKFNLPQKLQQVINLNLAKANEKGLTLTLSCDPKIPKYLVGDYTRFTGIAQELVTNALKYTSAGSVTVKASLEKQDNRQIIIKLSVTDTGIGIAEDKKQEIFTRFSRLTPSYEGKYVGLGLGLSVIKQFIDDLSGEIYVISESQKGSTFTCYLPFSEALSPDDIGIIEDNVDTDLFMPFEPIKIKPFSKINQDGTKKLLLVEDEEICALFAQTILQELGYQVDLAKNGTEALQKYKINTYDLIFMDVGLPDINGIEVTRKIRVDEKTTDKHVPIIALTAHIDNDSKQQCVESGMDTVLSKPIEKEKIGEILNAFIPSRIPKTDEVSPKIETSDLELLNISGEVMDFNFIKEKFHYKKNDPAFLSILSIACKILPLNMSSLQEAKKKKDWKMVEMLAHKISGSASYLGGLRTMQACHNLETYLMANKTRLVNELCALACNECQKLHSAIENLL